MVRHTPTVDEAVEVYLQLRKAKFSHNTWINDRGGLYEPERVGTGTL